MATRKALIGALLAEHGRTFSAELGIPIERGTPSPLFRWLCASLLMSARISTDIAVEAARALADSGWTTPRKMADATWGQRVKVLNRSGYARYDESTSRMLGDTCDLLIERYGSDLRKLREAAGRKPETIRERLKDFKGIGDVGVDIFFREAQSVWGELYPFADRRALQAAKKLNLPSDGKGLSRLVSQKDFPRLVAALVRLRRADDYQRIKQAA
jgi:hypothetical protein